jgi:hypothetical protein
MQVKAAKPSEFLALAIAPPQVARRQTCRDIEDELRCAMVTMNAAWPERASDAVIDDHRLEAGARRFAAP